MIAHRNRIVALVTAAVVGVGATSVATVQGLSEEEPDVAAVFEDASPLIEGNDVKASGVKVGTISSIEVRDGKAVVSMALDDAVLPLHEDATARVRPLGLLGERYVELDRGSADAPVMDADAVIPVQRTSRATDLDEVLDVVDEPTGTALSILVTTLGEGLSGRGADARDAIKALAPAMRDTEALAEVLDQQNATLVRLLESVEPVAAELATERGATLDGLLDAAEDALGATARNDAQLDETLGLLPGALRDTRQSLDQLSGTARSTTPVLRSIRPTTDRLAELSDELTAFARATRPALDGLDPVLAKADDLLRQARPVARSLSRSGPDLKQTADAARPFVNHVLDNLDTVLDFVRYWALTTNGEDGIAHYFRAHYTLDTRTLSGLVPGGADVVPNLPPVEVPGPVGDLLGALGGLGLPSAGKGGGGLGGLLGGGSSPGGLLGGPRNGDKARHDKDNNDGGLFGNLLGRRAAAQKSSDPASATGLSVRQEKALLSFLIGGE